MTVQRILTVIGLCVLVTWGCVGCRTAEERAERKLNRKYGDLPLEERKAAEILDRVKIEIGDGQHIRTIAESGSMTSYDQEGTETNSPFQQHVAFPDKSRIRIDTPGGTWITIINGNFGWEVQGEVIQELQPEEVARKRIELKRSVLGLFKYRHEFKVTWLREEMVSERKYDVLKAESPELQFEIWFDSQFHTPYRLTYEEPVGDQMVTVHRTIQNLLRIEGFLYPIQYRVTKTDGTPLREVRIDDVRTNIAMVDGYFDRPHKLYP